LTAAIHLKSGVNLHVAAGATLKFSPEFKNICPWFSRGSKARNA
jgi:polygalacturonase